MADDTEDTQGEKHATSVPGFPDMKTLAETVGDLRYDALYDFLLLLADKLEADYESNSERDPPRNQLALNLYKASIHLDAVADKISAAWDISESHYDTGD